MSWQDREIIIKNLKNAEEKITLLWALLTAIPVAIMVLIFLAQ